jgi:transposase
MNTETTWRTDDQCPCCGTSLHITDTAATVTFDCGACGWTLTADLAAPAGQR